jgi:hypothetical protein
MKRGKTFNSFLVFKYRLRSTISTIFEFVNENYAFENFGILSLNNEAENATLTQACEVKWSKTRYLIWKTSRFHRF